MELKSGPKLRLQLFSRAIFKQYQFHPEMQKLSINTPAHNSPKMPACFLSASAQSQRVWGQQAAERQSRRDCLGIQVTKAHQDRFRQSSVAAPVPKPRFLIFFPLH